jgi:fumarate reductase subunit D
LLLTIIFGYCSQPPHPLLLLLLLVLLLLLIALLQVLVLPFLQAAHRLEHAIHTLEYA